MRVTVTLRIILCGTVLSGLNGLWAQSADGTAPQSAIDAPNYPLETVPGNLPDSPGATRTGAMDPQGRTALMASALPSPQTGDQQTPSSPQNSQVQNSGTQNSAPQNAAPAAQSAQEPQQKPVGTAVAEPSGASGVAASQPAGAAIAPAKQRHTKTIILRVGAIIGAGVAVGTVAALTMGTSSKPPGAH